MGVDPDSGLAFPDFPSLVEALEFSVVTINNTDEIRESLTKVYEEEPPVFCNIEINPNQKLYPFTKSGMALENQLPEMDNNWRPK